MSFRSQFAAKAGLDQQGPGALAIGLAHQQPARKGTDHAFERADVLIGDQAVQIGRGQQRLDGAEQDEIIGADQFVHGAMEPVADKPRKPKIAALRHQRTR